MRKTASLALTICLILSVLIVTPVFAQATEVWVATTGSDSGNCSQLSPCKTIQYALSQLGTGGTIHVADGTYTISSPIIIQGKSGLSILGNSGNPAAVTVTTTDVTWQANIFNLVNSNHITISGMKLIISPKMGDPIILTYDPVLGYGSGSNDNTIRNVITNGGWEGIRIDSSSHNTVKDSIFEKAWHGIFIQGHDWSSTEGSDYNVIEKNTIRENYGELGGSGLTTSKGILVLGSAGTVIRNNMIQGGPGSAEDLLTLNCIGVFASIDNIIENNEMKNCKIGMTTAGKAGYGITIDRESTFTSFKLNNIVGNSLYGVESFLTTVLNAENNWWGSPSGPYHATLNPTGTGNAVSDNVDFAPWLGFQYGPNILVWGDGSSGVSINKATHQFFLVFEGGSFKTCSGSGAYVMRSTVTIVGRCTEDRRDMIIGSGRIGGSLRVTLTDRIDVRPYVVIRRFVLLSAAPPP